MITLESVKVTPENGEKMEVSIHPICDHFIIQISSLALQGTLIIDNQTDREELRSLSDGIADILERMDQTKLEFMTDNENPQ